MITWGLVAMSMALVRTHWQFYLVRFLLGAAEAGFFPGVIYYLGLWFPQTHRGRAISRFYIAAPLASVVMGAVAGSLLGLDGPLGLHGWQWLLIAEGAPAVVLAFAFLQFLPDRPADAAWLSTEQRSLAGGPARRRQRRHRRAGPQPVARAAAPPGDRPGAGELPLPRPLLRLHPLGPGDTEAGHGARRRPRGLSGRRRRVLGALRHGLLRLELGPDGRALPAPGDPAGAGGRLFRRDGVRPAAGR